MGSVQPSFHGPAAEKELTTVPGLEHLPRHIRNNITPPFWTSYRELVRAIASICQTKDGIPNPMSVLRAANATGTPLRPFIERGAKPDYAVDFILDFAMERSIARDGAFDKLAQDPRMGDLSTNWVSLPRCDNDLEFSVARRQLRLLDKMGPYA